MFKAHSRRINAIASIIIAFAVAVSMMAITSEDVSAASKKPGKVKVTSMTKLNQMVTVKWKKTKRAKKYQIYAKKGKGKWKRVATVKDNGKKRQYYRVKGLKWNTKYQFKMRAVNGKKKGAWSRTWKGKLAKKTTLQKEINRSASLKRELKQLNAKLNNEVKSQGMSCSISAKGNTLIYNFRFAGNDFSYDLPGTRQLVKNEFVNASTNREMKKEIVDLENNTGIKGISIRLLIYDSASNLLLDHTYR